MKQYFQDVPESFAHMKSLILQQHALKLYKFKPDKNPSLKQEDDDEVLLSVYYLVHAGKGRDSCAGKYALRGVLHALQDGLIPISILAVLSEVRELREKGTYDAKRK